jgi:hypothetical protein
MSINIDPTLWGPSAWKFMHYITLSYPDKPTTTDMNSVRTFFTTVANLLPCEKCRAEYTSLLKQNPLTQQVVSSRNNLSIWLLDIHNKVNVKLGKPEESYQQMTQNYMGPNTGNYSSMMFNFDTNTLIIILIVAIILILVVVLRIKNSS